MGLPFWPRGLLGKVCDGSFGLIEGSGGQLRLFVLGNWGTLGYRICEFVPWGQRDDAELLWGFLEVGLCRYPKMLPKPKTLNPENPKP